MPMNCVLSSYPRFLVVFSLAVSLCFATPQSQAQNNDKRRSFVIDLNRSYVYLKFNRIGKGPRRWDEEPDSRIWFQLVNNCRVPIIVETYAVPEGSPKDEQGVMDRIVANEPPSAYGMLHDGTVVPKIWKKATPEELPHAYSFETGGLQSIAPGKSLLFSVAINHLGERWHFEIPFEFDIPKAKIPRDPIVGGLPYMVIEYTLAFFPPEHIHEILSQSDK